MFIFTSSTGRVTCSSRCVLYSLYTFAIIIHILLDASVFTTYPVKDIAVSVLANDLLDLTLDINFTHI